MLPDTVKLVCPLCRKSVRDDGLRAISKTRLCGDCRSLVQTIVPDRWSAAETPEARYFSPVAHPEVEAHVRYNETDYVDADGIDDFDESQYEDDYDQSQASDSPSTGWPVTDPVSNGSYAGWRSGKQAEWSSPQQEDRWAAAPAQTTGLAERQIWSQTLIETPEPVEEVPIQIAQPVYQEEIAQPAYEQEPVYSHDPWENPLPAGETSLNEWPILVQAEKRKSATGLKALIGVAAVAALGVAGYFFAYKPFFAPKQAVPQNAVAFNAQARTQPEAASDSSPAQVPAAPVGQPSTVPPVTPLSTDEKKSEPAASNDPASDDGAYSLQAISSSSEEEANKFSEKLMRAGISAYVVSANIPNRGRWYRVRIGRFRTREDAIKYGEQSKMRAKAVGIRLDLIVSPYEKP